MSAELTVVSIGTLSSNPFWREPPGVRTAHATTSLVRDGGRTILVDPSLPAPALISRLFERTGLKAEEITDVFCTTLRPTHRRALEQFAGARWLTGPEELEAYAGHLEGLLDAAERAGGELADAARADLELIRRFEPAPEKLTDSVHRFPLPGASVGSAGLLLANPTRTWMIAGDAALTQEHVLAGRVWQGGADARAALESLREIVEIADAIVCGHDNLMVSPGR